MWLFLKALTEIIALRRGPEHLPRSAILLAFSIVLWLLAFAMAYLAFDELRSRQLAVAAAASVLAFLAYQAIIIVFRKPERTLQTQTALIGCGSLISIVFVLMLLLGGQFGQPGREVVEIAAQLLAFWSVPVKGHIIARAVNLHWYAGIGMAIAIFVLQYGFTDAMTSS